MRAIFLLCLFSISACEAQLDMKHDYTNALAQQTSPYLLQHAHNPVDWNPWGDNALAQAKASGKLMLISVGYSACHWCHVMERESFEDTTVAKVMNEGFVSVKVDREERPDIDNVYMTACHLTSGGSCGWPLNAIALPDGRPVWAGTYFPKERWIEILNYFIDLQQREPEKLEAYAQQISQQLNASAAQPPMPEPQRYDLAIPDDNVARIVQLSDPKYGGLGGAPKFPMPIVYEFLLTHKAITGKSEGDLVLDKTLAAMARGGIYDQLGGGFARYSVDAEWHAPHFEKMLYDNGQLVSLYAHAFRQNQQPEYADVVRQTLAFVDRELTSPEGGFYSSLDADSEGVEGKFYVWTYDELKALLTASEHEFVERVYGVTKRGNWEKGVNILHRTADWATLAQKLRVSEPELRQVLAKADAKLMANRDTRIRPGLDDKILVSWNGLMLKGYVDAYLALGDPGYLITARRNANYIATTFLQADGRLLRTSAKGKTHINAFLDDYANLADAYLALYQASFEVEWLEKAQQLIDYALVHFDNEGAALLYFTSDLDPKLVTRRIEDGDNVIASSNSVMADNLLTLGHILGNEDYTLRAKAMVTTVLPSLAERQQPAYWSRWLTVYTKLAYPIYEVAIVGEDAVSKRLEMASRFTPNAVYFGGQEEGSLALLQNKLQEESTLIYVCENRVCQMPTDDIATALEMLIRTAR